MSEGERRRKEKGTRVREHQSKTKKREDETGAETRAHERW